MENKNLNLDQEVKIVDMVFGSSSAGTLQMATEQSPPKAHTKAITGSECFIIKEKDEPKKVAPARESIKGTPPEGEFTQEQEEQIQLILKQLEEKVKERLRQQNK